MNKNTLIIADGTKNLNDVRQYITNVIIPDSVTSIRDASFYGCSSLTEINIPDSVTSIGDAAFFDCVSLKEINIPNSVTEIGYYAFYCCDSLKAIYIDKEKDSLDLSKTRIPEDCKVYWKGEF